MGMCFNPADFGGSIVCEGKRGENMKREDCFNGTDDSGMMLHFTPTMAPTPVPSQPTPAPTPPTTSTTAEVTITFATNTFVPPPSSTITSVSLIVTTPSFIGPTTKGPCGQSPSGQLLYTDKCGVCGGTGVCGTVAPSCENYPNCPAGLVAVQVSIGLAAELGETSATVSASCANYTAYGQCVARMYPACLARFQGGYGYTDDNEFYGSINCSDPSIVSKLNTINCASICAVTAVASATGVLSVTLVLVALGSVLLK